MNLHQRFELYSRLREANPTPSTELEHESPFELLVSVVLSAQATDKSVNLATAELFRVANTPQTLLKLGRRGLERYIKRIGLYRTKAKNVIATCKLLIERHGGAVPRTREELEALPGVGRKTANVVLGHALGVPGLPVDRHVLRVANRLGIARSDDPVVVEQQLCGALPPSRWIIASDTLILHGRRVCRPKPLCEQCPATDICVFFRTVLSRAAAPRPRRRTARPSRP
jgi:endonuclease-3